MFAAWQPHAAHARHSEGKNARLEQILTGDNQ
jgi:hypothetical protein